MLLLKAHANHCTYLWIEFQLLVVETVFGLIKVPLICNGNCKTQACSAVKYNSCVIYSMETGLSASVLLLARKEGRSGTQDLSALEWSSEHGPKIDKVARNTVYRHWCHMHAQNCLVKRSKFTFCTESPWSQAWVDNTCWLLKAPRANKSQSSPNLPLPSMGRCMLLLVFEIPKRSARDYMH